MFGDDFVRIQLLSLAFLLLFVPRPRYGWIFLNYVWSFLLLFYMYFFLKLPPWVFWPFFSYAALSCYFWGADKGLPTPHRTSTRTRFTVITLAALVLWFLVAAPLSVEDWKANQKAILVERQLQSDVDALKLKQDHLYVIWGTAFPFENIGVFGNYAPFKDISIFWLSSWQNTPFAKALLEKYKIKNIFKDMVNRKNVNFILCPGYFPMMYHQYLSQRFQMETTLQLVFHGASFDVYRVLGKPIKS